MDFIKPTAITDSLFFGANVPETDYQEWDSGTPYTSGDAVIVSSNNVHKIYECVNSVTGGLSPDILDEDCEDISDWTDGDGAGSISEVSPAGQFRFWGGSAKRYRTLDTPPSKFTIEIKTFFSSLSSRVVGDTFCVEYQDATKIYFKAVFASDGLFIADGLSTSYNEVGTDIVKSKAAAAWQTWRFEVDRSAGAGNETVAVFLKEEGSVFASQGSVDCAGFPRVDGVDGRFMLYNSGDATSANIQYVKVATDNGKYATLEDTPVGNTDWLEIGPTNRWAMFDGTIGNQTSQATPIIMALAPGAIDSVALLNIESTSVDIVEIDNDDNLVTNGTAWTGATGTTQPNSWDKVGTPADYAIDDGMIKITTDAANEGQSQTIAVSAATEYQLLGKYKNTAGDIAQIAIYDVTHSADILATTDLASSTVESIFSQVFTTPAGCISIKISLMGKANGDIVWFDAVTLAPTEYSETVTTGTSKTDLVKLDIPQKANGILTITVNYTAGTAKIGELIVGVKTSIGTMRYNPSIGITDYSTKTVDTFGHYSIVARTFAKRLNCSLMILNTAIDEVIRLLTLYRSTELVWVGDANYNSLIVYGFYKNFQVVFARPQSSDCSLEIEGLT